MSSSNSTREGGPGIEEVVWLYRVLLGRDPENSDVIEEARGLPSFDALRERIMSSAEFKAVLTGRRPEHMGRYSFSSELDFRTMLAWFSELSASDVQWSYRAVFDRDCSDEQVVKEHLLRNKTLTDLLQEVMNSDERLALEEQRVFSESFLQRSAWPRAQKTHRENLKRILLFGAYGNGNLGDECQPDAVYEAVVRNCPSDVSIEMTACSWERIRPPKLKHVGIAPYQEVVDCRALQEYDFLLIGGGGLLGVPHYPLYSLPWVKGLRSIGVPYGLLSVGASRQELTELKRAEPYKLLLDGAAFVTARDADTLAAFRPIRPDTTYLPDPCSYPTESRARRVAQGEKQRIAFVPKVPSDLDEQATLRSFIDLQHRFDEMGIPTEAFFFEPALDRVVAEHFRNPTFVQTREEYIEGISRCSIVLSMRYHGVLLALANGVSCWGFGPRKLQQLFELMGIDRFSATAKPDIDLHPFDPDTWQKVDSFLDASREAWTSFCATEFCKLTRA